MRFVKIRIFSLLVICHLISTAGVAQQLPDRNQVPPLKERIFFGGNFGLQLGTYTNIEVSPLIGLRLLPRLSVAAGPTYQYYKDPYGNTDLWGGRAFMRITIIQDLSKFIPVSIGTGIFTHSEYEGLSLRSDFWGVNNYTKRFMVHSMLLGFGISQPIGRRGSVNFMVLWVLNGSEYQIYDNPEIRIGFNF